MGWASYRDRVGVADPDRVLLVSAAHGANEFFSVALPPVLPLLVAEFGLSYARAGLLLTVFFATYSVCQLPAGFVADRVGKPPLIAASIAGLAAGVLLASTAQSFETLVVAQVVGGISGSAYHPAGMSLISDVETGETEGTAMGIHGFGGIAGIAVAPVLVGGLAESYTWRLALVGAGVVGFAFTAAFVVLAGRDGGLDAGDDEVAAAADPDPHSVEKGLSERIAAMTALPVTRWLLALLVLQALVALQVRAAHSFTTTFAYETAGLTTATANGVFLAMLVGSAIASLWAGDLADRMDRVRLGAGAGVLAALLFALTPLVPGTLVVLVAWFFVVGLVTYLQTPAMNAITAAYAERSYSGGLFGVMATGSALGGAVAPTLFGVLATGFDESVAFAAIGVACLLGAAAFGTLAGAPFRASA